MVEKKAIRGLINTFGKSELMALMKGRRRDDDDDDDYSWSVEFKYWFWLGSRAGVGLLSRLPVATI